MADQICAGTRKSDGLPCVVKASEGSSYCHHHDPDKAEAREQSASRAGRAGGRGRGGVGSKIDQVERIRRDMRAVASSVLGGEVSSRAGDTIIKALNGELRALTELHKMQDVANLERRLDELEEVFS